MADKKGAIKLVTYEAIEETLLITVEQNHTLTPNQIQLIQLELNKDGPFIITIVKK
ncbi:MAG: hypothetical protein PHO23_03070 [Candidatus Pacebacteria bacterium]|nr:hypothetical protein [Candidatus Paceibacterota bacterium]